MKRSLCASLLLLLASAWLLTTTTHAEGNFTTTNDDVINVAFEGGTASEYLDALARIDPGLNVVRIGALDSYEIPDISLRNVTIEQALNVLGRMEQRSARGVAGIHVHVDHSQYSKVFTVKLEQSGRNNSDTKIWSVADLTESGFEAHAILSAVETALMLVAGDDIASAVSFHEDTHLLMIRGPHAEIAAIDDVINQLRAQPRPTEKVVDALEQALAEREDMIAQLEARLSDVMVEFDVRSAEVAESRAERTLIERQLAEYEDRLYASERKEMQLREETSLIKLEYERLMQRYADLEARLKEDKH